MADQLPTTNSPAVPGNLKGTLAGAAASVAVSILTPTSVITTIAAWITKLGIESVVAAVLAAGGVTITTLNPATLAVLLVATIVGGVVNYCVTHYATMKALNDLYAKLPSTEASYPPSIQTNWNKSNIK